MSIWNKCDMCGKELGKSALIYKECGHIICGRHKQYADFEAPCPRCAAQHSVQRTGSTCPQCGVDRTTELHKDGCPLAIASR